MRKFTTILAATALLGLSAGVALALDSEIMRDIRRADAVDELVKVAEDLAERTVSPERESKPVPSAEDLKIYLQLIQVKMDAAVEAKEEKRHKELLTALGKK